MKLILSFRFSLNIGKIIIFETLFFVNSISFGPFFLFYNTHTHTHTHTNIHTNTHHTHTPLQLAAHIKSFIKSEH